MAPYPYTTTYTAFGKTYTYTYNRTPSSTSTLKFGGDDSYSFDQAIGAAIAGYVIALAVIFGLQILALIIVAIVYFRRQSRRKAWYGPMAEYYRNGGLPPWAVGGGSSGKPPLVQPPLVQNDYSSYTSGSVKSPLPQTDYSSYPPTPSQPQYVPSQRYSAFTPYDGPPPQSQSPQPQTQQPYTQQPQTQQPYTQQPYTQQPYTQQPYTSQPYTSQPSQPSQPYTGY